MDFISPNYKLLMYKDSCSLVKIENSETNCEDSDIMMFMTHFTSDFLTCKYRKIGSWSWYKSDNYLYRLDGSQFNVHTTGEVPDMVKVPHPMLDVLVLYKWDILLNGIL